MGRLRLIDPTDSKLYEFFKKQLDTPATKKPLNRIVFSSNSAEWSTPLEFFTRLDAQYNFTVDVAASHSNAKCLKYYTKEENGLLQSWATERVWCNPPYGRRNQGPEPWLRKASKREQELAIFLLPARTDVIWFHTYVYKQPNVEYEFLKGRLKFGGSTESAPFPSMLVYFL